MALEFFSQDDAFCDADFLAYIELQPDSIQRLDSFELGEYDKLTPWVERCRAQNIALGSFFDDTVLQHHQLPQVLANLRDCSTKIEQRPPFYAPDDTRHNPFFRAERLLQTAIAHGRGIVALCD